MTPLDLIPRTPMPCHNYHSYIPTLATDHCVAVRFDGDFVVKPLCRRC